MSNAASNAGAAAAAASAPTSRDAAAPSASAPAASAAASAAAASASSSGSPRVFDLSDLTRASVSIAEDVWIRHYPSTLAKLLLESSPRRALVNLIVYYQAAENSSPAMLEELQMAEVRDLCSLLGLPHTKRARDGRAAIKRSIQSHMEQFPHLTDFEQAVKPAAAARAASDQMELGYETPTQARSARAEAPADESSSSSSSDSEHEEPARKGKKAAASAAASAAPPSPRRSSRVPAASPARSPSRVQSKNVFGFRSSSSQPASSQPSKAQQSVLAALAGIPGAPSDDDGAVASRSKADRRKVRIARDSADGRKGKKGKGGKKDKKHEKRSAKGKSKSRRKASSDEDSDSDGPGGRRSSSDESSDSSSCSSSSSSDSSRSSSSDSDDASSRRHRKRTHASAMESNGLTKPLAKLWIRNAIASTQGRGTILDIHKEKDYKQERNKRECEALSKIVDCLRKKHPDVKRALEFAVRRLVGVQTADMSGNWAVCDQFELVMDKQSFVPDEFLARALKNAARIDTLEQSSRPSGRRGAGAGTTAAAPSSGPYKSGGGSGKQNKSRGHSNAGRDRTPDPRGPASNSTKSDKDGKGPRKK